MHRLYTIADFCAGKRYSDDSYVDSEAKAYYNNVEEQAYNYINLLKGRCNKALREEAEDFIIVHNYWE